MTNEEVIKELKEDIELYMPDDPILLDRETPDGRLITALEIAINAIEAVDYDCANCKWYLKANNSDYPDLEEDEREREETE